MLSSISKNAGLLAGAVVLPLFIISAQAGYAQSATGVSDDDYISALSTMAADMDLN